MEPEFQKLLPWWGLILFKSRGLQHPCTFIRCVLCLLPVRAVNSGLRLSISQHERRLWIFVNDFPRSSEDF